MPGRRRRYVLRVVSGCRNILPASGGVPRTASTDMAAHAWDRSRHRRPGSVAVEARRLMLADGPLAATSPVDHAGGAGALAGQGPDCRSMPSGFLRVKRTCGSPATTDSLRRRNTNRIFCPRVWTKRGSMRGAPGRRLPTTIPPHADRPDRCGGSGRRGRRSIWYRKEERHAVGHRNCLVSRGMGVALEGL